jgi:hypothetical protein
MRSAAVLLVLSIVLLASVLPAASASGYSQLYANRIIHVISTPDIAPGGTGRILLAVFNPFNSTMSSVMLRLSIYEFASTDTQRQLAAIPLSQQPKFSGGGTGQAVNISSIPSGTETNVSFGITTTGSTMHGDFFNVGTYYVSTYISFILNGSIVKMASRGAFTDAQWAKILVQDSGTSYLNYSYLNGTLGYQGISPDTSFTVDTPSPLYLLWVAGGLSVLFAAASYVLYRREKHGL